MEKALVKSSLNLSEILSRFAKLCKFRSIGVFPDHKPNLNITCSEVEVLKDDDDDDVKAKETQVFEISQKIQSFHRDDDEISKLFDIAQALKLAYLEFQRAHVPYDPDKIIEADNLVVSQLEALRKCKRIYLKTKQTDDRLRDETEVIEKHLGKLKAELKAKESEIHSLKEKLHCLVTENTKLEERITTLPSFESAFRVASKSVHDFAKPLIALMKATDWNLDKAVESIVGNVAFSKNSDKKYAFESYIVRRMFHGLKLNPCDVTELLRFDDPLEMLTAFPDSAFSRFCAEKYLLVVHPSMEASFFGNLDMRGLVLLGKHPRTMFYRIFARMAKCLWILGSFAGSLDVEAKIFVVRRGTGFSDDYMESVKGDAQEERLGDLRVEFITMPGFKLGDSVVKSQVYLSETKL